MRPAPVDDKHPSIRPEEDDAPPGRCQLEVGSFRLVDGARLAHGKSNEERLCATGVAPSASRSAARVVGALKGEGRDAGAGRRE